MNSLILSKFQATRRVIILHRYYSARPNVKEPAITRPKLIRQFTSLSSPDNKHNRIIKPAVAHLKTINLVKLMTRDPSELNKLLEACQTDGFFYLGLTSLDKQSLLGDWRELLSLVEKWFNQPLDNKMKYHLGTVLHG